MTQFPRRAQGCIFPCQKVTLLNFISMNDMGHYITHRVGTIVSEQPAFDSTLKPWEIPPLKDQLAIIQQVALLLYVFIAIGICIVFRHKI